MLAKKYNGSIEQIITDLADNAEPDQPPAKIQEQSKNSADLSYTQAIELLKPEE